MKKGVIISNINDVYDFSDFDAYLIPINDLSINYAFTFSIDDVLEIKKCNKEVFVIINKNIENNELDYLKKVLKKIDEIGVSGILFYDVSIVQLKKELNLKTDLVWSQEHLTTNSGAINYWFDKGCKYTYLSSEITKSEIEEIRNGTKAKLMVNVYGYVPIFTSKRHLVDNYCDTFKVEKGNYIYKEGRKYHILDNKNGTVVYCDYLLNVKEDIDVDYIIYNSNFIDDIDNNVKEENGFLYKETIYKVK